MDCDEAATPWPGQLIAGDGRYQEGSRERRAAIFIGLEFGTVTRPDLVEAVREAADAEFDVLIARAFNFEAHTTEFTRLGSVSVLKARMNADLHMAEDLRKTAGAVHRSSGLGREREDTPKLAEVKPKADACGRVLTFRLLRIPVFGCILLHGCHLRHPPSGPR